MGIWMSRPGARLGARCGVMGIWMDRPGAQLGARCGGMGISMDRPGARLGALGLENSSEVYAFPPARCGTVLQRSRTAAAVAAAVPSGTLTS